MSDPDNQDLKMRLPFLGREIVAIRRWVKLIALLITLELIAPKFWMHLASEISFGCHRFHAQYPWVAVPVASILIVALILAFVVIDKDKTGP